MAEDLDELFRLYRAELNRLAYRSLGSQQAAADVVQDAFLRYAARPQPEVANPRAFLRRIVSNLILDRQRHARRQPEHVELDQIAERIPSLQPAPEQALLAREELELLHRAILELPPRGREVFLLHRFGGLDYAQIGERLGISPNTVMVHMTRAFSALRKRLRDFREGRVMGPPGGGV